MHEFALAARIVGIAAERAEQKGQAGLPHIELLIDEMSGCCAQRLGHYFEVLAEDAGLAGARLTITATKARMECTSCGTTFERQRFALTCPACQGKARPTPVSQAFFIDTGEIQTHTINPLFPFVSWSEQKKVVHTASTPQGSNGAAFFCVCHGQKGDRKDQ